MLFGDSFICSSLGTDTIQDSSPPTDLFGDISNPGGVEDRVWVEASAITGPSLFLFSFSSLESSKKPPKQTLSAVKVEPGFLSILLHSSGQPLTPNKNSCSQAAESSHSVNA